MNRGRNPVSWPPPRRLEAGFSCTSCVDQKPGFSKKPGFLDPPRVSWLLIEEQILNHLILSSLLDKLAIGIYRLKQRCHPLTLG